MTPNMNKYKQRGKILYKALVGLFFLYIYIYIYDYFVCTFIYISFSKWIIFHDFFQDKITWCIRCPRCFWFIRCTRRIRCMDTRHAPLRWRARNLVAKLVSKLSVKPQSPSQSPSQSSSQSSSHAFHKGGKYSWVIEKQYFYLVKTNLDQKLFCSKKNLLKKLIKKNW